MAKVPFTKLKLKTDDSVKHVQINDEITIEVKQYLPIQEKLLLVANVLLNSVGVDVNYANSLKIKVYTDLEIIKLYTNLKFDKVFKNEETGEEEIDVGNIYDELYSSGIIEKILNVIPEEEKKLINENVYTTLDNMYKYQNSVLGLLSVIKEKYDKTDFDITEIQNKIQSPETLELVKTLAEGLG